jgi:protocatechuate 3,4-dioxygenase beta subunit
MYRTGEAVGKGVTGTDGKYEFTGLPNAESLLVAAPTLQLQTTLALQENETRPVILHEGSSVLYGHVLQHGQGVYTYVTVSRGDPNAPDYDWKTMRSQRDGTYTVRGLVAGTWQVEAVIPDHRNQIATKFINIADNSNTELNLELPGATIHGVVVDQDNNPVYAAQVFVTSNWNDGNPLARSTDVSSSSNSDGEYVFDGLEPGSYSISASQEKLGAAFKQNIIITDPNESRELLLRLRKEGTGTVISTVLDLAGKPLQNAKCVLLSGDMPYAYTELRDSRGVLEIQNVPAGDYQVIVSAPEHSSVRHQVTVESAKAVTLEDVLESGGALSWTLYSAAGLPLQGVQCITLPVDPLSIEAPRTGATDRAGQLTERGLRPGEYEVTARPMNHDPVTEHFQVTAGGIFGPNDRKQTTVDWQ